MIPLAIVTESRAVSPTAIIATLRTPSGDATLIDAAEDGPAARALLQGLVEPRRYSGLVSSIEATPFSTVRATRHRTAEHQRQSRRRRASVRRSVSAQDVPQHRRGDQPRARGDPLPQRTRAPPSRRASSAPSSCSARAPRSSTRGPPEAYVPNEGSAWTHAREDLKRALLRAARRHETPRDSAAQGDAAPRARRGPGHGPGALCRRSSAPTWTPPRCWAKDGRSPPRAPRPIGSRRPSSPNPTSRPTGARKYQSLRKPRQEQDVAPTPRACRSCRPAIRRGRPAIWPSTRSAPSSASSRCSRSRCPPDAHSNARRPLSPRAGPEHRGRTSSSSTSTDPRANALTDRRRRLASAFRDVARMIFSFQYAAASASSDPTIVRDVDRDAIAPWAAAWHRWVSAAFLRAYLDAAPGALFIPPSDEASSSSRFI